MILKAIKAISKIILTFIDNEDQICLMGLNLADVYDYLFKI